MNERLPPLTALRAFEAAARHLSFAQGAAELHVTPAALSFQIKSLEAHLGQPVFRRLNRAVELTETGRILAIGTGEGFQTINTAWRNARRSVDTKSLTITAGPAFTANWLAPRLFDFAQKHPDIEVRFSATLRLLDFDRDEVDLAIRFGEGDDAGMFSQDLIYEWMTPMMCPKLAEQIKTPADLQQATLLHQDDLNFMAQTSNWSTWFKLSHLAPAPRGGPRFSQSDHALNAAMSGSGVVLGRFSLAERALRDGQLVAPFPLAIRLTPRYRFICPQGAQTRPQVQAFLDWIMQQVDDMYQDTGERHFINQNDLR